MTIRIEIAPSQWEEKDTMFRGKHLDRFFAKADGYEIRYNVTRAQIYIPAKPKRWNGTQALVINNVNFGVPDRVAGHGATWDNVEVDLTQVPSAPEPEIKIDDPTNSHIAGPGDPWTSKPRSYDECVAFISEIFMADAPYRNKYFDLNCRWNHRKGPPGARIYPKRGDLKWEDVVAARKEFYKIRDAAKERLSVLSGYCEALFEEKKKADEEQRKREAAERAKPVDLTDPAIRAEYNNRNRRLMQEQQQNQERALQIARSRLAQFMALPQDKRDADMNIYRDLSRTVERIEWELAGMPMDKKPSWIEIAGQ